jgi:hypothetical protein
MEDCPVSADYLQARFVALLPRSEIHARIILRGVPCPGRRADRIAATVALAWLWFIRLAGRGKAVEDFPAAFVSMVARAGKSGHKLAGVERARDAMNPLTQQRHGFRVEGLPASTRMAHDKRYGSVAGQRHLDAYEERLRHNNKTPLPEIVAFRIDFPCWLTSWADRDLAQSERTSYLAGKFGLSPALISQQRREYHADWLKFCGETAGCDRGGHSWPN